MGLNSRQKKLISDYMLRLKKYYNATISVTELSEILTYSIEHTRRILRQNKIEGAIKLDKRWVIPIDSVQEYLYQRAYNNESKPYQTLGVIVD
tara:strand:+ start:807 stop:1085 length:279 start_codon:yes stop_codon:yes gene_type:complete